MPRQLMAIGEGEATLESVTVDDPGPTEVVIELSLSVEKHGTRLSSFTGERDRTAVYDHDFEIFLECEDGSRSDPFPAPLGNMGVGTVAAAGEQVERFTVGDRVFGYLPIAEQVVVEEDDRIRPAPETVSDEELVCTDPATVALLATRYSKLGVGDHAAFTGLGAIGLMGVQLCANAGALEIVGVDPVDERRRLAEAYGATETIDPTAVDVGREITMDVGENGVDVTLETSGVHEALQDAIRATRYGGTIVTVSHYHGDSSDLDLSKEWHFNRQELIAGARVESEPYHDHPRWHRDRVYESVLTLFERGALTVSGLLDPVPLERAPAAYERLTADPTDRVKLAVTYGQS